MVTQFLLAGTSHCYHGNTIPSCRYVSLGPFCTDSPLHGKKANYSTWVTTVKTLTTLELGLPSIITFFSFLVCAVKLAQHCPDFIQKRRNRRASVTVAVFTGLFLFCNLPFFTLMVIILHCSCSYYTYFLVLSEIRSQIRKFPKIIDFKQKLFPR